MSEAADSRGNPHLLLKKKGSESELSVYSVEQLDHVLKIAGNKKVTETRICLEGIHCAGYSHVVILCILDAGYSLVYIVCVGLYYMPGIPL